MVSGEELIPRLIELYKRIDRMYVSVAEVIGLQCEGCDGVRCCTVDVTVHTAVEMLYLRRGFFQLDDFLREIVSERALAMVRAKEANPFGEKYRQSVCALNFEGRCLLYEFRPMICRLAGIPHWFVRPDGRRFEGGGCSRYEALGASLPADQNIDRTPFYHDLALLESEIVRRRGVKTIPRTIAELLVAYSTGVDVSSPKNHYYSRANRVGKDRDRGAGGGDV